MKSLQDNLVYYQQQRQTIINNKANYQSTRTISEYGAWQQANYTFSGRDILAKYALSWWYSVHWTDTRKGQHMKSDPTTKDSIRKEIAQKLGRPLEEISTDLVISPRGEVPTHHTQYGKAVIFNTYTVGYQHRNLHQRNETFFDQAKYDQALRECENNITSIQATIREWQTLDTQITKTDEQINDITAKIKEENIKRQKSDSKCKDQEAVNKSIQEKLEQKQDAIYKMLQSADDSLRASYLAGLFDQHKAESTIELIKSLGFDANELANIAVSKNQTSLFDLALKHGANCCNYFIDGTTLLQRIIHNGEELFLQRVLSKGQDLTSTLINAISKDDILTIDKLLSLKPELLKQKYAGYTLLQIAIAAEGSHTEVIKKILSLDSKLVEVLTNNHESALKIAVRIGDKEVIKLVSQYANIKVELEQFGSKLDASTKAQILANQDFGKVIELYGHEKDSENLVLANQNYGKVIESDVQGLGYDGGHKDDI